MKKQPSCNKHIIYIQRDVAIHAASFKRARVTIQNAIPLKGEAVKYTDLSQVWHDKDERPDFDFDQILAHDEDGSFFAYDRDDVFGISDPGGVYSEVSWKEFVEDKGVERWAYARDLLPSRKEVSHG